MAGRTCSLYSNRKGLRLNCASTDIKYYIMEETEIPTEGLQEEMHHHAEHSSARERWISHVALSSAILAAFAAVSALLSGHHANDAMLEQLRASDHWSYYQAKGIKSAVLSTRISLLESFGKKVSESDHEKLKKYEDEQQEISKDAKKEEADSHGHLALHEIFARAVTFFQIAIAIGAVAALTKRRRFFYVSLASGAIGLVFLIQGLLTL